MFGMNARCAVKVSEPHPHEAPIALAAETANASYLPELSGNYFLVVATDVFVHVFMRSVWLFPYPRISAVAAMRWRTASLL